MVIGKIKLAPNNVAWYDDKTRIVLDRKHPIHDVHDYHDMRNIEAGLRAKLIIFIPEPQLDPVVVEDPVVVDIQPVVDPVEEPKADVVNEEPKVEEPEVEAPAPKKRRKNKKQEGVENE